MPGNASNSGFIEFRSPGDVRQGYIGLSSTNNATDAGTIPYVAGTHSFSGVISGNGSSITNLNASNLASGTVPTARLSGSYNIDITGSAPWSNITGKPTTLSGYGITDAQPLDSDLTAIAGLSSNGLISRTGNGTAATRSIAVSGTGLSVSNADGVSGNPTITSNATSANTASTIVARDASGNFSAGTITASLTGSASNNVLKAGDTMTGNLTVRSSGSNGATRLVSGTASNSGYIEFRSHTSDVRQGYIGFSSTDNSQDTGTIPYVAGTHSFSGVISGNGSSITNLNASNLASGTAPAARLGTGTPSNARFLRGDGVWSNQIVGDYISVNRDTNSGFEIRTGNQATNEKSWYWMSNGSTLTLRAYNDAGSDQQNAMQFTRSGFTVTGWEFRVNNNAVISANSNRQVTIASPASGSHTINGDVTFGGAISVANGTASAPTLRFSSDTDCGIYRHAADTVGVNTDLYANGEITAFSDARVKRDVEVIVDAVDKVNAIRGITYIRTDLEDGKRYAGVIAQEVEEVLPEVVRTGEDGMKAVNYDGLTALLIEAIKELSTQNKALLARIEALEAKE
jgi:hypothetical protein